MSVLRNSEGALVPIREQRRGFGTFSAINNELVVALNGDESALVHVQSSAFIGTLEFSGSNNNDNTGFYPIPAYILAPASSGGTIPISNQPMLLDALVAANTSRIYAIPVGQLRQLRVRVSAYTSGSLGCSITTDTQSSLNTAIIGRASTLTVSATAAVSTAVTATLPAVAGLRHIVDFIRVTRSATVALTASATPLLITTTNLPGSPVITMGADAAGIGVDKEAVLDFGSSGLAASTLGTATTVVCPVATGSIWRVNIAYRLGL